MDLIFNPFSITLISSGLIVAILSIVIVSKMEDATRWIAITMLCGSIWGISYGLELSSITIESIFLYLKIQYIGISFLGASWLIFALKYTDTDLSKYKMSIFFILLVPSITFFLVITNESHHLHYTSYRLVSVNQITGLKTEAGPWYIIHVIYSYVAFLLGNLIIWRRYRYSGKLFKTHTLLIFIAGLFPIVFNIIYQFGIYKPFELIDLTPYAFLFSYLVMGIAILRYQLFSIKPIAKNIIFEAITKGVLVVDRRHKIVDFNSSIFSFFPDRNSMKIGFDAKIIFESNPDLLKIFDSPEKQIIETQLNKDSSKKITYVEIIPLQDRGSIRNGTIILFEDITEDVNTKNILIAQKTELEQLNNLKDKYFSIISHDLKGPIYGVKELINLTQSGLISNEEFIDLLPEVSKNIENVSQLLENLLTWTSSQLRGEQVLLEIFDIREIIVEQKQLLERVAAEKNITISVELPEEEFRVECDKNMVDLIIRNLINNALKFSPPSSEIIISAGQENNSTVISVKDFGTGISQDNLKKINEGVSFTTKGQNSEGGTGLGLILVQEYIKKNSGTLKVESTDGVGSTFSVYLRSSN